MATTAGRRLFELLQEKQEPLLIRHGCSRTRCQAALCWIHGVCVKLRSLCIRRRRFMRRTGADERATLSISKPVVTPPTDRAERARFSDHRRSCWRTRFGRRRRRLLLHCHRWEIYRKRKGWSAKKNGEMLRWKKQSKLWQTMEIIDLSASGQERCCLQPEIRDIGLEIESIIFEEMREEAALVLLGSFSLHSWESPCGS